MKEYPQNAGKLKVLPSPEIIRTCISKIIKAFEDVVQTELIRVRWEEIKRLQVQPVLVSN